MQHEAVDPLELVMIHQYTYIHTYIYIYILYVYILYCCPLPQYNLSIQNFTQKFILFG
jgi:hypothetical protein